MNNIEKLTQIFTQFPGIGPRQAKRFVYYLLTQSSYSLEELAKNISDLKNEITVCENCQRFFQKTRNDSRHCKICLDQNRNQNTLMIVQRDIDLESVEKNKVFDGVYFVLGGSLPILEKEPEKKIRLKELKDSLINKSKHGLEEIILAMNWNPEGENTASFIKNFIEETFQQTKELQSKNIKISLLGKGLSMGAELEYTDTDTLKNALKNRG